MCYITVSLNCFITNFKQNGMITKSKPSQQLGAVPPDLCTWDLLIGIGAPLEKFLPTPLKLLKLMLIFWTMQKLLTRCLMCASVIS